MPIPAGEVAVRLNIAAAQGADFAAARVPDTPGNRAMFARMQAFIVGLPKGAALDIPPD
jgi:hypothetical protein